MERIRSRFAWLPAVLAVMLAACTSAPPQEIRPDFSLPSAAGGKLALSSFRGQLLYVDFWATWCGPCIDTIPELNALHEKYKGDGFQVLGVSIDDFSIEQLTHFVQNEKIVYPIVLGNEEVMREFGPAQGLPTGYLLDREGVVRKRFLGQVSGAAIEAALGELLREPRKS